MFKNLLAGLVTLLVCLILLLLIMSGNGLGVLVFALLSALLLWTDSWRDSLELIVWIVLDFIASFFS